MKNSELTRNISYCEILEDKKYLSESLRKVFACFRSGGKTLREISETTGMDLHLVSARISDLRNLNLVTDTSQKRISKVTGKLNTVFIVSPDLTKEKQLSLL